MVLLMAKRVLLTLCQCRHPG